MNETNDDEAKTVPDAITKHSEQFLYANGKLRIEYLNHTNVYGYVARSWREGLGLPEYRCRIRYTTGHGIGVYSGNARMRSGRRY